MFTLRHDRSPSYKATGQFHVHNIIDTLATTQLQIAVIGTTYGRAGNSESHNKRTLLFKTFSTSNEESFSPMRDKQETICRSQKRKEIKLELSQNKMLKHKG